MSLIPLKNKNGKAIAWRLDVQGKRSQIFYRKSTAQRELTKIAQGAATLDTTDMKPLIMEKLRNTDARKDREILLADQSFPLPLIKRFISTLPEEWTAHVDGECVRFFWSNGKAHINSVNRAVALTATLKQKEESWKR